MNVRVLAVVMLSACSPILTPVVGRQPLIPSSNAARIIWVFDQSGSMEIPISPCAASPTCGTPGNRCPPGCPTRETVFRAGTDTMVARLPESVLHIPIKFPSDSLCGPPLGPVMVGPGLDPYLPADAGPRGSSVPSVTASELHSFLAASLPTGGSPTAASLRYVASFAPSYFPGPSSCSSPMGCRTATTPIPTACAQTRWTRLLSRPVAAPSALAPTRSARRVVSMISARSPPHTCWLNRN